MIKTQRLKTQRLKTQWLKTQRLSWQTFLGVLIWTVLGGSRELVASDYYVYVAAESADEIYMVRFDGTTATIADRLDVGYMATEIEGPHGITVSPDGKHWFVTMAHGKPYGILYKYTTGTNQLVGEVELGLFPATMQISDFTGLLYCVNFDLHGDMTPSSVSIVDPDEMVEIGRTVTGSMPHGSRVSHDGRMHYSCSMMDDRLYEIDAITFEITRTLDLTIADDPTGIRPRVHPDHEDSKGGGGKAEDKNNVTPPKEKAGNAEAEPPQIKAASRNASGKGDDADGDRKKDAATAEHGHQAIAKPTWVFPHPSGEFLYVALNGAQQIVEVDRKEWKITRRFATGEGPYNVEVTPDGNKLVATYKTVAQVGIWDLRSGTELSRIPTSRRVAHGVVLSPDNRYAFVSCEGVGSEAGTLDVFDLGTFRKVCTVELGLQMGGLYFWKKQ